MRRAGQPMRPPLAENATSVAPSIGGLHTNLRFSPSTSDGTPSSICMLREFSRVCVTIFTALHRLTHYKMFLLVAALFCPLNDVKCIIICKSSLQNEDKKIFNTNHINCNFNDNLVALKIVEAENVYKTVIIFKI
jgi:hypothetical protein